MRFAASARQGPISGKHCVANSIAEKDQSLPAHADILWARTDVRACNLSRAYAVCRAGRSDRPAGT